MRYILKLCITVVLLFSSHWVSANVSVAEESAFIKAEGLPTIKEEFRIGWPRRSWTCHATVALIGTNQTYTPQPRYMRGSWFTDRERACRNYYRYLTRNPAFLNHFSFSEDEKNKICRAGTGVSLHVIYGFDRRGKAWNFRQNVKPRCVEECTYNGWK